LVEQTLQVWSSHDSWQYSSSQSIHCQSHCWFSLSDGLNESASEFKKLSWDVYFQSECKWPWMGWFGGIIQENRWKKQLQF
jgi:hypothetical protein